MSDWADGVWDVDSCEDDVNWLDEVDWLRDTTLLSEEE
jgi:hypothetical protein